VAAAAAVASATCPVGRTAQAITVNPTYDSSVLASPNMAAIENAFNYVCLQYQNLFTDPVSVNITVSVGTSGLGMSSPSLRGTYTYAQVRSALTSHATSADDTAAVGTLGSTDPTPSGSAFITTRAEAKALGLLTNSTASDGVFLFNGNYTFT